MIYSLQDAEYAKRRTVMVRLYHNNEAMISFFTISVQIYLVVRNSFHCSISSSKSSKPQLAVLSLS